MYLGFGLGSGRATRKNMYSDITYSLRTIYDISKYTVKTVWQRMIVFACLPVDDRICLSSSG